MQGRSNVLIVLAPYVVPLATIPLLFLRAVVMESWWIFVDLLIGASLAFHVGGLLGSLKKRQPDFTEIGMISSVGLIIVLNVVVLLLFASYTAGDTRDLETCVQAILIRTVSIYQSILNPGTR
jgi:hypothetical protein